MAETFFSVSWSSAILGLRVNSLPSFIHVLYINNNEFYTCGLQLGYFETTFSNFFDKFLFSTSSVLKGTDDFSHEKRKGVLQK